jgi:tRNA (adenine22-N1)-methyltransferase
MNFSRGGDSLSQRLKQIRSFYTDQKHIWDIGCDHGDLGLSFAADGNVQSIQLVDPSQAVVASLLKKIKDSYITKGFLNIVHQKGQEIVIAHPSNCIFIAGMGGKEISEIIQNLLPQLDESSRLIISPHRKILELRSLLNGLPMSLEGETTVFEDGQFYQVLCLIPQVTQERVSLFGENIWKGPVGESYRQHQIKYFTPHKDLASVAYVRYLKSLSL